MRSLTIYVARSSPPRMFAVVGVAAVSAGLVATGLLVPLALLGASLFLLAFVASSPAVRAGAAARRVERAREARRRARERQFAPGSPAHDGLIGLTRLLDEITAHDPWCAERMELEDLLDRHVALTIAHEQSLHAIRIADRVQLERTRDSLRGDPMAHPRRVELCERRLRCLAECEVRAERLADELAMVADLLRLIAQRIACADAALLDDTIDRRLAQLDDEDLAHRELVD